MNAVRPEFQGSPCPEVGMRAWYLNEAKCLESELGFSTSNFVTIPWHVFDTIQNNTTPGLDAEAAINLVEQTSSLSRRSVHPALVDYFARQLESLMPLIEERTQSLQGDTVIVRPSPLDEHAYPDLSFAGVYKSHMPHGGPSDRRENLLLGTANVLAGRFTKYGNAYYDRHGLNTDRLVGIMYMQPFFDISREAPLMHGTAYIAGDLIRNEYVITPPPDQPQREPRLMARWGGGSRLFADDHHVEDSVGFEPRMSRLLDGLHSHFNAPLDVEYLVDKEGRIFVVQIRKISAKHLANWEMAASSSDMDSSQSSAIVNSVGAVEGSVIDLRRSMEEIDLSQTNGAILVINHEDLSGGMHTQALLDRIRIQRPHGLKVVVDHGEKRVRDHLQYAMVEDPGIDFVLQTGDPKVTEKLVHGTSVRIESNGLAGSVVRA